MKKLLYTVLALSPSIAFAQSLSGVSTLLNSIRNLVDNALPLVVGLALLGFFWGLMKFIFAAGNEDSKADRKKIMIMGIIALFVMVSVWGLVDFIGRNLDINQTGGDTDVPGVSNL